MAGLENSIDTQDLEIAGTADRAHWMGTQQLTLLYRNSSMSLFVSLCNAALLTILLWPVISADALATWLTAIAAITGARLYLGSHFARCSATIRRPDLWRDAFLVGVFVSGLAWGSVSIWLFPTGSMLHQVYIAFVLAGMCAGAVAVYSPLPAAFLLFAIPAIGPFFARIAASGMNESYTMAAMVLLFILALTRNTLEAGRSYSELLELQSRNADLTRALHYQATHDSLVGLVNHGEFTRRLHKLAADSSMPARSYCLVFIDLDLFKQVNDTGGHAAGDALLCEIARILKVRTRSRDTAARVGGDEFALLLESCPEDRALDIAEGIRREISNLRFFFEGKKYQVGASFGVAFGCTGEHSATAMLKTADAACYKAKNGGRNQVKGSTAREDLQATGRFDLTQIMAAS